MGAAIPALLWAQSRPPKVSIAWSTIASTSCLHRHIGPDEGGPTTASLDQGDRLVAVFLVDVGHHHAGTLAGEDQGGRPPDPQARHR